MYTQLEKKMNDMREAAIYTPPYSPQLNRIEIKNYTDSLSVCCIGFSVLGKSESIHEVYTTLIARFPTLPKVIIYDNGCNLHDYFLNRSLSILKETIILSDDFHWKNHTRVTLTLTLS
ncbi:hypothetical protein BC833DRAFT_564631 [Globomyces pollinis-pini]|nr:hypothetical protein BC833DRAFT_564631 [Globomyces pollinis-pini]